MKTLNQSSRLNKSERSFAFGDQIGLGENSKITLLKTPSGLKRLKVSESNLPILLESTGELSACTVYEPIEQLTRIPIHNERGAGRHEVPIEFPKGKFTSEDVIKMNKKSGMKLSHSCYLQKIRKALQNKQIDFVETEDTSHQGRPFRIYKNLIN